MTSPIIVRQEIHPATGLEALVYEAPAPTGFMLERAAQVLRQLQERLLPTLPIVLEYEEQKDGSVRLVLKKPGGSPLMERLLSQNLLSEHDSQNLLSEPELLGLMLRHLQTLEEVHRAGYAGLRPTWSDIWWDVATDRWTILGWEWLVEGKEAAAGDLRAAAATWIELVLGAPPGPELIITRGPFSWRSLTTGLRHLLLALWEGRDAGDADAARAQAERLYDAWCTHAPERVLLQARDALEKEPLYALSLFEIAARRRGDLEDADARAYEMAKSLMTKHTTSLIQQGRRDFRLGQYQLAQHAFQQALSWPYLTRPQALTAARWLLLSRLLHDWVAQDGGLRIGVPARELENQLDALMDFVEEGRLREARDRLLPIRQRVQGHKVLAHGLQVFDSDLQAHLLWMEGCQMEAERRFDEALTLFQEAEMVSVQHASHHPMLFRALEEDLRRAIMRLQRWRDMKQVARSAWHASAQQDLFLAAQRFRQAARLAVDWPEDRTRYMREAFRMELWNQLDFHPSPPAVTPWPQAWLDQAVVQLETCQAILKYFPGDAAQMGQIQEAWREALLQVDPTQGVTVLRVLAILDRFWKRDQGIRGLVTRAVKRQILACQHHLEALSTVPPRTPSEHKEAIAQLETTHFILRGLLAFSSPKDREDLEQWRQRCKNKQEALQRRLDQIKKLRVHYEQIRQGGGPALPVLEEAQRLGVELFDEPTATVRRLMTLERIDVEHTRRTMRLILYRLATTALEARQLRIARSIRQFMQSPDQEERFLEMGFKFMEEIMEAISTELQPDENR